MRTYEQLQGDFHDLSHYVNENRASLEKRGILTPVLESISSARARLDSHQLWPDNPNTLAAAYRHMCRAWLRIQSKAMTDSEIGEGVSVGSQDA